MTNFVDGDESYAYSAVSLVTGATESALALADVKSQLNLTASAHDTWLDRTIVAAERYVENKTNRVLISSTFDAFYDRFPWPGGLIELPKPDVSAVDSISYVATDGSVTTWDSAQYVVDIVSERGRIWEAHGFDWPATRTIRHAVTVRFQAGYANASAVPDDLKHAMLMLISHWFNNRDAVLTGTISKEVELGVEALLASYVSRRFF